MENQPTNPPFVRITERPGEPFDILQVNVPLPRALISSPAAEHFGAAGRELALAIQALVEQFRKRAQRQGTAVPTSSQPPEVPMAGATR